MYIHSAPLFFSVCRIDLLLCMFVHSMYYVDGYSGVILGSVAFPLLITFYAYLHNHNKNNKNGGPLFALRFGLKVLTSCSMWIYIFLLCCSTQHYVSGWSKGNIYVCHSKICTRNRDNLHLHIPSSVPSNAYFQAPVISTQIVRYLAPLHSTTPAVHQLCQLFDTVVAEHGTVTVWFGSASQVTSPELSTLIYLYSMTVPGAKLTVTAHSGSLAV